MSFFEFEPESSARHADWRALPGLGPAPVAGAVAPHGLSERRHGADGGDPKSGGGDLVADSPRLAEYRRDLAWQKRPRPVLYARQAMRAPVLTLAGSATLAEAWTFMRKHAIGHVPVCDVQGRPMGMFSDHDVFRLLADGHDFDAPRWKEPLRQRMRSPLLACSPEADLHDVAGVFLNRRIGSLVVVEDERVVGVVTRTDLLRCLMEHPTLQLFG